ncbi:peptidase C39 family protein [Candidatus Woesearchaeota archaeon]|nr:peptidase C39 family protein [Candidatus Woesearchaeota archaeon]
MKLNIPFYPMPKEKANYCGQFVLKPIFRFLLNKEYDLEFLSELSEKFDNGFTLTIGLVYAALHEGLKVRYITKNEELVSNEDVPNLEKMYNNTKLNDIQKKAKVLFEKSKHLGLQFQIRKLTLKELKSEIDKNNPVVVIIDYGKAYDLNKQIFHFVIITGYDHEHIFFHDVGPKEPTAHKKLKEDIFYNAWTAPGTDMDTVIFSK